MNSALKPVTNKHRSQKWFGVAIALSLALHLILLLIPLIESERPEQTRELQVSLQKSEPDLSDPEPLSEIPPAQDRPEYEPEPMTEPMEEDSVSSSSAQVRVEQAVEPIESAPSPERQPNDLTLSSPAPLTTTRLLANVRANLGPLQVPEPSDAITPAAPPRLPDAPGWINEYVGRVETQVEQWKNADGTREARIVTASGQVYCGRASAPTNSELFNPQFAMNIMLFRDCGRVRPQAVDRSDPWTRAPDR